MTIKTPVAIIRNLKAAREERASQARIEAGKAVLAETKLVPGYTNVYA